MTKTKPKTKYKPYKSKVKKCGLQFPQSTQDMVVKKSKKKKPIYKLTVQIGKKKIKGKVYRFNKNTSEGLVKALLTINIPKMMEEVTFTLEKGGKTSVRSMNAFRARRVFDNKLNAFYLIKHMHWVFK